LYLKELSWQSSYFFIQKYIFIYNSILYNKVIRNYIIYKKFSGSCFLKSILRWVVLFGTRLLKIKNSKNWVYLVFNRLIFRQIGFPHDDCSMLRCRFSFKNRYFFSSQNKKYILSTKTFRLKILIFKKNTQSMCVHVLEIKLVQ